MERATQAWAETSIGGVALSRSGISLMISALQCKYSTKMETYKNKNRMTVWSQLCQKYFHVHLYTMGELFCTLLEAPAGDSLNKGMSLLRGYLLLKRFQMASMGHRLECSPVERKGNNYFPLVRSDTSKASTEELLGTGTKNVNMYNMNKKIENLICRIIPKNYNLWHTQNASTNDLVLLWWPLPSPHPGQGCSVGGGNDPAGLQRCFLGEEESICNCQCFKELCLKTRHSNIQDCSFLQARAEELYLVLPWNNRS